MESLFHLGNRKPMQTTNDSTVHWTESSTNSAAAYAFHMSDIFTDIDGKSHNPVSEDSDLLPESQARYYSMVVVLVLAGLFFGFTLTVTIAVGVFCRKKNTVFVFQKAEQEDAGYEMRGNDTEEDEDDVEEEEDKEEGGKDDDWMDREEEINVKTGSTSIVANASEPLFESLDSSDEFQTHVRHKSLEVLDRRSRAPRSSGNLDGCLITPQQKLLAEAQTLDAADKDCRQILMEVTRKAATDGDPLYYRSQDSLDSSMDSSENTVIEVTSGGQFLPFRSSRVTCDQAYEANDEEEQSSIRGFSDDDYSADEEDEEETLENSFLCQYDASFKPEMGVLLPEMKSQNRRQNHLSPDANIRHPEVRLLLHDVTLISSANNFRRTDQINDEGNIVIPQL